MPQPNADDEYVKNAEHIWTTPEFTFILLLNLGRDGGYIVRVFPHDDSESLWLRNGPWETESGAAWSILNYLNNHS